MRLKRCGLIRKLTLEQILGKMILLVRRRHNAYESYIAMITQPNKKKFFFLFAKDISRVLGYVRCADSENGHIVAELALVFEIYSLH